MEIFCSPGVNLLSVSSNTSLVLPKETEHLEPDLLTLAVAVFALMGMFTMMAFPVTMYLAQNVLPEYKSVISGFINGFSWGIVAIFMTLIGFSAQNFGITKVLLIVAIIPAACSPLVRLLNVSKEPA